MGLVRTAKLSGNGAFLLPKGVTSIQEIPWDLAAAIDHAIKICSWQENLIGDEIPPYWMWPFDSELEIWFENVDRQRKEKYGDNSEKDEVPMMDNEFTERFRR